MESLTPKQQRAIMALLSSRTDVEAAQKAGIGDNTLWRWKQDASFRAALEAAWKDVHGQMIGHLTRSATVAIKGLEKIVESDTDPASVRMEAAETILKYSLAALEIPQIKERISELERLAKTS